KLNPNSRNAHYNRGAAKKKLGDMDGAVADFDRASELTPALTAEDTPKSTPSSSAYRSIRVDLKSFDAAEEQIILAGDHLRKARTTFYVGLLLNVIGGALISGSQFVPNRGGSLALLISGSVVSAGGSVTMLSSFIPIGRAGHRLKRVKFPNEITVKVPN
ncbi:MAG: hypothetical protein ACI9LA_001485, partial [Bacteroidia bacterium]